MTEERLETLNEAGLLIDRLGLESLSFYGSGASVTIKAVVRGKSNASGLDVYNSIRHALNDIRDELNKKT